MNSKSKFSSSKNLCDCSHFIFNFEDGHAIFSLPPFSIWGMQYTEPTFSQPASTLKEANLEDQLKWNQMVMCQKRVTCCSLCPCDKVSYKWYSECPICIFSKPKSIEVSYGKPENPVTCIKGRRYYRMAPKWTF